MNIVLTIVLVVQMLSALAMIGLILVQHGKGADMGAAFGSGASGSANFLSRTTAILASIFFICTLALAYFGNLHTGAASSGGSALERAAATAPAPAVSGAASQIPTGQIPAGSGTPATPAAPTPAASGAAQIPAK